MFSVACSASTARRARSTVTCASCVFSSSLALARPRTRLLTWYAVCRYHELYMKAKGNVFKNKVRHCLRPFLYVLALTFFLQRVLMDHIHKAKAEQSRTKVVSTTFQLPLSPAGA